MRRFFATFLAIATAGFASAAVPDAGTSPVSPSIAPKPPAASAKKSSPHATGAQAAGQLQAALDQLTQTNHELLDLIKKQQAVLQDMQFSTRLQSRQVASLEERLEEALAEKHQLQDKVDSLERQLAVQPMTTASNPSIAANATAPRPAAIGVPVVESVAPPSVKTPQLDPPPPASYLPAAPPEAAPGMQSWHRLFTIKGDDNRQTDLFLVRGKTWRVVWHNQDKPGKLYANTSALFINAFPKDDTIPQKVSAKLGSGGDATLLSGPGNYYLKIEASGGSWELAVEDYR